MLRILFVVTNTDRLLNGEKTGIWLSEFAEPYDAFTATGHEVMLVSPKGGRAPFDPKSLDGFTRTQLDRYSEIAKNTRQLKDIDTIGYDGLFLCGGHGTMFDLPDSHELQEIITHFADENKTIGAICHGAAGFVNVKLANGKFLLDGRRLTSFTDNEEKEMQADEKLPFLLETKLRNQGATFVAAPNFMENVEIDKNLITAQNPQSGERIAKEFLELLEKQLN
ncbi:type 1 glutamine amidotransferase domain-containing protein [Alteribacillus sp. HJP-4]|uniref:type 1 glutamine amidotransferase domain-containing protein n=1 Tax=Alteribacillus sp. HJP-4 TaxID=2775394 RepID=UPI0035CD0362